MMKKLVSFSIVLFFSFLLFRCSPNEPIAAGKSIYLEVKDVLSTKVWLTIKTNNISLPAEISVARNDSIIQTITLTTNNTLIVDENLLPNTSYTYQLFYDGDILHSQPKTTTTLELPSHSFIREIFTFKGGWEKNVIEDVWIINENDIWVVGSMYDRNIDRNTEVAHWDGTEWTFYDILRYSGVPNVRAIVQFENEEVWFSILAHWNGNTMVKHNYNSSLNYWVNAMWGIYGNNFFTVGNNGSIVHYYDDNLAYYDLNNVPLNLYDIYGRSYDEFYLCGGSAENKTGVLVKGNNDNFEILKEGKPEGTSELFNPYFAGNLNTVWQTKNGTLYFGGEYLYYNFLDKWDLLNSLQGNSLGESGTSRGWSNIQKIRGNSEDDFVFCDEYNALLHFNGKTWQQLGMDYSQDSDYSWKSVDMKEDVIVAVGKKGENEGIVMILRR